MIPCFISLACKDNFVHLIQTQLSDYFVTTVLSLQPHLGTIIMWHLFFVQKKKVNKKYKSVTSRKCKRSKTRATYSIHRFWKQYLSSNNALPNFADDLCVHKRSSVSEFSTFNIIVDNFFSLDTYFLSWTALSKLLFLSLPILILFLSQHLPINLFLRILLFIVVKLNVVWQVQGNSTSFSGITSKCILSKVPVTNTSWI